MCLWGAHASSAGEGQVGLGDSQDRGYGTSRRVYNGEYGQYVLS